MKRKNSDQRRVKSIKRKVGAGFTVLAFILFFSSIVSLFEYTRMNRVLTHQITENVHSVNIARELIMMTEDYNLGVLDAMSEPDFEGGFVTGGPANAANAAFIQDFSQTMEDMRRTFTESTSFKEKNYADSVLLAYTAYMQVLRESLDLEAESADLQARQDWYFNRLQPFYMKLRDYIRNLTNASQQALVENSQRVDETFYRSITPAIASVVVGLLVVMLFNYFINFYLINPLIKINKGIQGYRNFGKDYTVEVDNNGDELDQLNGSVREIVEDHKTATKGS